MSCEITRTGHPSPQRYPFWMWWNLLSLDAPTVVWLWAVLFIHAFHTRFHFWELAALAAAVWIIYAGDRVLDVLRKPLLAAVSDRHNFYARHGRVVLGVLLAVILAVAWISFTRLSTHTRAVGLTMCIAVLLYFLAIHAFPNRFDGWLPKELIAGAIFAAGATIPAWTSPANARKVSIPAVLLFAGLCGLNCIAIECWEHNRGERRWESTPYWLIRLVDTRIMPIAAILVGCITLFGVFGPHTPSRAQLLAASAVSLSLIAAIEWQSNKLSPQVLRVLADAALLTPVLFLLKPML